MTEIRQTHRTTSDDPDVVVVGSGPAGLSCAAELLRRGRTVTVLERGPRVAHAWATRYDALRFNTSRGRSALVGHPFPRAFGRYPTRDQYVRYLDDHRRRYDVDVRTGVQVTRIDREDDGRWTLRTSRGPMVASDVVVATGVYNRPRVPDWARSGSFPGTVLHSSAYREPSPFAGADVLVVGAGSTGLEIAHDLARGGASSVRLAVRTPPTILYRDVAGLPGDLPAPALLRLPARLADPMLLSISRLTVGDLTSSGLGKPAEGPVTQLRLRGAGTAVVDPEVVRSIREGAVRVVPAVVAAGPEGVRLADGTRAAVDAVVLATGYTTGLEDLVGHLGVLDDRGLPVDAAPGSTPGLWFVGFVYRPGLTRLVSQQARRLAPAIARHAARGRRVTALAARPLG